MQFAWPTLLAALVVATAAWTCEMIGLDVWVMFAGLVAWLTKPASTGAGLSAIAFFWLGALLGILSDTAVGALTPGLKASALPIVMFGVALVILGLRTTVVWDKVPAGFLGLAIWFALEQPVSLGAVVDLLGTSAIGGLAGWLCQAIRRHNVGTRTPSVQGSPS